MRLPLVLSLTTLGLAVTGIARGGAQDHPASAPVEYRVRMDLDAKEWEVSVLLPREAEGDPGRALDFWLPRWTAGAYHLADYGRFVKSFAAHAPDGRELAVTRDGPCHFVIEAGAATPVQLDYRAEQSAPKDVNSGMLLDVEGSRITPQYSYLSPNSLLGFCPDLLDRPTSLQVELPEGWRGASAMPQDADGAYRAASWYRLEDSPLLFSPQLLTESFEVDGVPHRVSVFGKNAEELQGLTEICLRLARSASDWMQGLPYERYQFLLGFAPEAGGSGLEHSESTLILVSPGRQMEAELPHLIAHEYFHLWCAERIHVQALERPDYTQPFHSGTIWVNEGITEYFCQHLLLHAGITTREQFFLALWQEASMARAMAPMLGDRSWTDVSREAADWDDMSDLLAFSLKHYQGACATILALDLEMRRCSEGERGVADLLRYLFRAYAMHGRGFGEEEMPAIVDGIAQGDLSEFFARYVDGPQIPDLKEALQVIGYTTQGGLQRVVPVSEPTQAQVRAREDFFTPPPARTSR